MRSSALGIEIPLVRWRLPSQCPLRSTSHQSYHTIPVCLSTPHASSGQAISHLLCHANSFVADPDTDARVYFSHSLLQEGKPYILSMAVGPAEADPRSQGYTVVSKTEFANMEDLKYYDDECSAHQELKVVAKTLEIGGIMTVYFKPQITGGLSP